MDGLNFIYKVKPESSAANLFNKDGEDSCWKQMKMGKLYAKTARYDDAVACYDMAIQSNGKEMSFYFYRGIARFHLKDLQGALDDLKKAKSVDPWNMIDVLNYLSCIQFRLGDYKAAKENLARVLIANRGLLNDLVMTPDEFMRLTA
ncbi:MAG: tetratricopeptide (TPR) repeat protein [Flavobacteriales bacterium]|jgi:tetratricopeptide (TPR) repeat protein